MAKAKKKTGTEKKKGGERRTKVQRISRSGIRRCQNCGKSIDDRGHRAIRCEPCAKKHLIAWRKKYDAKPINVEKRREYDGKPKNVKKAKFRRNKKIYLLGLCLRVLRIEGMTIDQAIDVTEKKLRTAGRRPPVEKKKKRGEALRVADHPWTTMRGKGPRKKRERRIG